MAQREGSEGSDMESKSVQNEMTADERVWSEYVKTTLLGETMAAK